jgi:hypothetical protein
MDASAGRVGVRPSVVYGDGAILHYGRRTVKRDVKVKET